MTAGDMSDVTAVCGGRVNVKRTKQGTPVGDISEEVVMERRRGLEWLIGGEDDWSDISLDT